MKAANGDFNDTEAIGFLGAMAGVAIVTGLTVMVLSWLYFALMESSKFQGTIGKLALGIIVTDMGIIILIGYIMAGFTEKKQALHDILAGTLVWKK